MYKETQNFVQFDNCKNFSTRQKNIFFLGWFWLSTSFNTHLNYTFLLTFTQQNALLSILIANLTGCFLFSFLGFLLAVS